MRTHTPPRELQARTCRCGSPTLRGDVGPARVDLNPTLHVTAEGFRWHPHVNEWVPVGKADPPNGWPVYTLHTCAGTNPPQGKGQAR